MIVQMSSANRHDKAVASSVKLRQAREQHGCDQGVSTRQDQFVARVVLVIVRRRNITTPAHGEAANLRLDLSSHGSLGLFAHASSAFVSTASTIVSDVRLGLTSFLGERQSQAGGRVKSVRRGHVPDSTDCRTTGAGAAATGRARERRVRLGRAGGQHLTAKPVADRPSLISS